MYRAPADYEVFSAFARMHFLPVGVRPVEISAFSKLSSCQRIRQNSLFAASFRPESSFRFPGNPCRRNAYSSQSTADSDEIASPRKYRSWKSRCQSRNEPKFFLRLAALQLRAYPPVCTPATLHPYLHDRQHFVIRFAKYGLREECQLSLPNHRA